MCCSKCGLTLTEIQKILEMQAENDPVIARFAATIGAEGGNDSVQHGPVVPPGSLQEFYKNKRSRSLP